MHGKSKKVSTYRQDGTGAYEKEPISWVKYNYMTGNKVHNGKKVQVLSNVLKVNAADGNLMKLEATDPPNVSKVHLGQEVEFFHDMRQYEDKVWEGGARLNTDIVWIPIPFAAITVPVPSVWPSISKSTSRLRSAVSNKIIFRSGILESVEAFDGGSLVKTENIKWNPVTGAVVLTSVNNNFDDEVFNYTHLAFIEYQGMGAAYKNVGITFSVNSVLQDATNTKLYNFLTPLATGSLQPGDEVLLYSVDSPFKTPLASGIYYGFENGYHRLYCASTLTAVQYKAMVVRSGFRNQLSVAAGTITALQDPSVKGVPTSHSKIIQVVPQ
jgi:hypothetical protein